MSDQNQTPNPTQAQQPAQTPQPTQTPQHGREAAQPPQQAQSREETSPNRPADTLRDGTVKATIWKRQGESGDFYATELARTYRDQDGNFRDSRSFSGTDLLRVSELAKGAYHRTNELRREQAQQQDIDPKRETRQDQHRAKRQSRPRNLNRDQSR